MVNKSFKTDCENSGFTFIELVAVVAILGILAVFALPKFFNLETYRDKADYNAVASALRYAQKLAVGSGCAVQVVFAGVSYSLQQHATTCSTGTFTTISGHPINSGTISGTNLISVPTSFIFSPMGRSSATASIVVGGRTIQVVAETGTVDAQ